MSTEILRRALQRMVEVYGHEHYSEDDRQRGLTVEEREVDEMARRALAEPAEETNTNEFWADGIRVGKTVGFASGVENAARLVATDCGIESADARRLAVEIRALSLYDLRR